MDTNYRQIYKKFTKGLSPKTKDIFDRRFGVKAGEPETLESIGDSLNITRERVRQIEEAGFNFIRKNNADAIEAVLQELSFYFEKRGGLAKEEIVLSELGGKNQKPYVLFLLTLGNQFSKVCEKRDFHYFWSNLPDAKNKVSSTLASLVEDLQKAGKLTSKKDFFADASLKYGLSEQALNSYVEASKRIVENRDGQLGLIDWPEVKPRGVKDKAFLVFKKHQKPLHFTEVAKLIEALPQTVHNELIKDSRFVLVGRGTYALADWGYYPGTIKEVIAKILKDKKEPQSKDEIIKEVLAQRLVAKNTVLMNLNNKNYFAKDSSDRYFVRKTETV